jgi:hypothetical protein
MLAANRIIEYPTEKNKSKLNVTALGSFRYTTCVFHRHMEKSYGFLGSKCGERLVEAFMWVNIVSLFMVLFMVFAGSSVPCRGDEGHDKPSGATEYHSLASERKSGDYTIKVDLSEQVLTMEIPKMVRHGGGGEERLYPIPGDLHPTNEGGTPDEGSIDFVSASILSAKAKQFDDGLYAAAEIAMQEGLPGVLGKKMFLSALLGALKDLGDPSIPQQEEEWSRAFIAAASSLGGQDSEEDERVTELSQRIKEVFLQEPLRSKPIGFYTWNDELAKIFRQDRLLQTKLEKSAALVRAIKKKAGQTKDFYFKYLGFTEKMTNPFPSDVSDLRRCIEDPLTTCGTGEQKKTVVFFPPSRSYETDLVKKLYGNKPIPDNFNLAETLIEEIKAGSIDLTPRENSGWYDYQTYSLESLVLPEKSPEGKKLEFTQSYREELEELFKSLLALTRETHIKQLEIPLMIGSAYRKGPHEEKIRIDISPELTLEPLATYYLRRARSYNFVHSVLKDMLGESNLSKIHRLTASGPVKKDLAVELKEMEALFFGAALIVANETGCALQITKRDGSGNGGNKDIEFARLWMNHLSDDPDVSRDNRMMVPVFYDFQRKMTKVWVVLGYEQKSVEVGFKSTPQITVFDGKGNKIDDSRLDVHYNDQVRSLWYPVFAEIYVKNILDRDEFRKLCDRYATRPEILKALQQ